MAKVIKNNLEIDVDSSPQKATTSALQTLPFENLIGGPLKACVRAQEMATDTTRRFIREIGFVAGKGEDEMEEVVMVSFLFQHQGGIQEITIPLLTLVPIPYISIDTIDISFQANMSASSTGELTAKYSNANLRQKSMYNIQQLMDVKVHASSDTMPAGLAKMMDLFSNNCIQIEEYEAPVSVAGVSLNKNSLTLYVGASEKLTETIIPSNATDPTVVWKIDDNTIATVDETGNVCALKPGNAIITVTSVDKKKIFATCEVIIKPVPVTDVELAKTSLELTVGDVAIFRVKVLPSNATNKDVSWATSNEAIATVSTNGKVTAVKGGEATITVTSVADENKKAVCSVTVIVPVTDVFLRKTSLTLAEGATEALTATIAPFDATNKNVSWATSEETVALVDANGNVTAVKAGTATITATTTDGNKTAVCEVTVITRVTSVLLDKSLLTLAEGEDEVLIATIVPENATNKNVSWKSSSKTATVDANGKVTAIVKGGEATITATSVADENKKAVCYVTVKTPVTGISLGKTSLTLVSGDSETLIATVAPGKATDKTVLWGTTSRLVAKVDSDGNVTARKSGEATITATTADGNKTATCKITVIPPILVTDVSLDKASLILKEGYTDTLTATIEPANATDKTVLWATSDNSVVAVDANGNITALKGGTATITATTTDGSKTAACKVTVDAPIVAVDCVTQKKSILTLIAGTSETLIANVIPGRASNKKVSWKGNNSPVVTVNDVTGEITAIKAGSATITVTTEDGKKTAVCKLKVVAAAVAITGFSLKKTALTLTGRYANEKLITAIKPAGATNKRIVWKISDGIAMVNQLGNVSALCPGKATITATTVDGERVATCELTVKYK